MFSLFTLLAQTTLPTVPVVLTDQPGGTNVWYALGMSVLGAGFAFFKLAMGHMKLQAELVNRVTTLEQKDKEQQDELDGQKRTIRGLRRNVKILLRDLETEKEQNVRERAFKHFYHNKLTGAVTILEVYRTKHGKDENDHFEFDPEEVPPILKKKPTLNPVE